MSLFLGIDSSAYTTSVALYNQENGELSELRRPLQVKAGSRGLQQSEAFFQHINNFPDLLAEFLDQGHIDRLSAVGVSLWPRRAADSYMPVFKSGASVARIASHMLGIPLYGFSHQEGHVFAGVYEYPELLLDEEFLAIHFSGGTSELIKVGKSAHKPVAIQILNASSDIYAGQLLDRVGVKMGLGFPAGAQLESLAFISEYADANLIKTSVKNEAFSFSGAETRAYQLMNKGFAHQDVALMLFRTVADTLVAVISSALDRQPCRKILLAGGVISSRLIRNQVQAELLSLHPGIRLYFTSPGLSSDNAAGIAYLSYLVHTGHLPSGGLIEGNEDKNAEAGATPKSNMVAIEMRNESP